MSYTLDGIDHFLLASEIVLFVIFDTECIMAKTNPSEALNADAAVDSSYLLKFDMYFFCEKVALELI